MTRYNQTTGKEYPRGNVLILSESIPYDAPEWTGYNKMKNLYTLEKIVGADGRTYVHIYNQDDLDNPIIEISEKGNIYDVVNRKEVDSIAL